jgi:GDPmannose 4,6-dehydratase
MALMLALDEPGDFVIATGETHSVREFCELAFAHAGLDYEEYVRLDPALFRPADRHPLRGDPARAHEVLGWAPRCSFDRLVRMMVDHDIALEESGTWA